MNLKFVELSLIRVDEVINLLLLNRSGLCLSFLASDALVMCSSTSLIFRRNLKNSSLTFGL